MKTKRRISWALNLAGHASEVGFDNALRSGVADQPGDVVDIQLLHYLLAMLLDCLDAEVQLRCDLLVGIAFRNELENFGFALGQLDIRLMWGGIFHRVGSGLFAQTFGYRRTEIGIAFGHLAYG